ncbi:flavin reductase (DIM6/NTAB) family NADH-FMN oxidoreductase RutF [Altererythrobacter atlanticus]|uniref:NADH-dependent flavin reductase n=1 Tax=Croceibacterium atlanticum TaxID=1267766 RepID=A0A0F7KVJ4_9SPHN|nr:flavin reductase family protein [Croceibacterium atlanticum]AKH44348.1 NADH-dependent flavin reductase [Croceibacterium atlanticum]MBB5733935.1 flavin reductase (DIM6/NTAB) family NADH-FMN oxidoreductase RutF [Croceibacterium atlanticum]
MSDSAIFDATSIRALRDCCSRFATGVAVITTRTPEGDHGMTLSAFMSVSLDPPLICISVDKRAKMLPRIEASEQYVVNVLPEHMRAHALHFAGRPEAGLTDLFEERYGLPVLREAAAVIVTDLVQCVTAGDHVLLVGHVRHFRHDSFARPLLWYAGEFGSLAAWANPAI